MVARPPSWLVICPAVDVTDRRGSLGLGPLVSGCLSHHAGISPGGDIINADSSASPMVSAISLGWGHSHCRYPVRRCSLSHYGG